MTKKLNRNIIYMILIDLCFFMLIIGWIVMTLTIHDTPNGIWFIGASTPHVIILIVYFIIKIYKFLFGAIKQ